MNTQYWLAELNVHDNPKLIDGPHDNAEGANHAAYLIQAMHLGEPNRRFAVAKVELTECAPSSKGANEEAINMINTARRSYASR
jgi:hypothetical protein